MNTLTVKTLEVTKRDGRLENINLDDKIHRVLDWAAEGLPPITVSHVEIINRVFVMNKLNFYKLNFIDKSISEIKQIYKINLLKFINQLPKFKTVIFYTPKTFLTARLKSTLFNDNYNEVSLYA